ncbi:MAG TPA: phosphatidate cytidylyltransferase [Stellaceae bacterium]|nr:phosphatidate cytidylyltransferase [Stellaceae bacterium]
MEPASPPNPSPSSAAPHSSGLTLRILSASVMVPVALAAVWFGSPYLPALVALLGAGMGWEWARMSRLRSPSATLLVILGPFVSACAMAFGDEAGSVVLAIVFAGGVALAERDLRLRIWGALATLWIALPCAAILWLDRGAFGREHIIYLFAVVWASDIGAYAFGRLIGGPKLAPALSPNKTWAGAIGGLGCAMVIGALAAAAFTDGSPALLLAISAVVAIAAQVGDLIESFAKRCFNVKDSGALIPGHGGLLDRLDSLLLAALALALALAAGTAGGTPP